MLWTFETQGARLFFVSLETELRLCQIFLLSVNTPNPGALRQPGLGLQLAHEI